MTDAQLAILVAAITALGTAVAGAIKWAVNRLSTLQDNALKVLVDAGKAMTDSAASNRELVGRVERAINRIDEIADFVEEETSGIHDVSAFRRTIRGAAKERERAKTPAGGVAAGYYGPHRPKTGAE